MDLRAAGTAPLGGCLSPYYISDAAAKAAPAVVNITVQVGVAVQPVGHCKEGGHCGEVIVQHLWTLRPLWSCLLW